MRRRARVLLALLAGAALPSGALAKEHAVHTPGGRVIYEKQETFGQAASARGRNLAIEMVMGSGPEGNFGVLLGWAGTPLSGLQLCGGFGIDVVPARNYSGSVRYHAAMGGYHPYVSLGYALHESYAIGSHSHNAFAELGYRWTLHSTSTIAAGLGLRRILHIGVPPDSTLRASDTNPALLDEQRASVEPWVPMAMIRLSRAF